MPKRLLWNPPQNALLTSQKQISFFLRATKKIDAMHLTVVFAFAGVLGLSGVCLLGLWCRVRKRGMLPITIYKGYQYIVVPSSAQRNIVKLHQLRLHALRLAKTIQASHPYLAHRLTRRLQRCILSDRAAKSDHKHVAYTINKGDEIVMCLSDSKQLCVLNYVFLHELAHVITKDVGHPPIFYSNLGLLTKAASQENICLPTEHSQQTYCDHYIHIV